MRDLMKQVDNSLLVPTPGYSTHNLDTQTLTTTAFGRLTPIYLQETVPGGRYSVGGEVLCRFNPLSSPLMHKCDMKIMYFYVPYRILWSNFEYFIQGKKDPLTNLDPVHPYYTADLLDTPAGANGVGQRIPDYFGLRTPQTGSLSTVKLNPFPLVAYQSIWNRHFRHQIIVPEINDKLNDGVVSSGRYTELITPRVITFEDDYFGSQLPTPQAVTSAIIDDKSPVYANQSGTVVNKYAYGVTTNTGGTNTTPYGFYQNKLANDPDLLLATDQLYADVSITVEEIRRASALQRYLETSNHVGNYIDYLKAFYNVDFPDSRLLAPEYIGGISTPVIISDVMNTADTNQGRLTGNGTTYSNSGKFNYTALEHGMIIGLAVVSYRSAHTEAKHRLHFKLDKFDYFNPIFDNLGEQAVYYGELHPVNSASTGTFGYVPKHFEYRSSFDFVTGEMGSTYMHWHLARNYNPGQALTESFYNVIDERRIFQVNNASFDPIMLQVYNNVTATLPMQDLPQPQVQ